MHGFTHITLTCSGASLLSPMSELTDESLCSSRTVAPIGYQIIGGRLKLGHTGRESDKTTAYSLRVMQISDCTGILSAWDAPIQ